MLVGCGCHTQDGHDWSRKALETPFTIKQGHLCGPAAVCWGSILIWGRCHSLQHSHWLWPLRPAHRPGLDRLPHILSPNGCATAEVPGGPVLCQEALAGGLQAR